MPEKLSPRGCPFQPRGRALSIKATQRAALDARNYSVDGIAMLMSQVRGERLDPATLRRYLSDTYPSCMPVDLIHPWFIATDGDLSPVVHQLHLCGQDIHPLYEGLEPPTDTPRLAADISHEAGDLVALLIHQWSDGQRSSQERREALPLMRHLRAHLDQLISADETATGGRS